MVADAPLGARSARVDRFAARASDARDAYVDNLKYALMLCVVWNHSMQDFLRAVDARTLRGWCEDDGVNVMTHRHARTVYALLNVVGMPLFACASGYLSKSWLVAARQGDASAVNVLRRVRTSMSTLLVTYGMWQGLYLVINYYDVTPVQWWAPIGVMWYLYALVLWRLSILVLGGLKDGVIMAMSLFMGLFVGFTETPMTKNGSSAFDWQRLFVYSVYFFFGLCVVKPEHIRRLEKTDYGKRAILGSIVLISSFCGIYYSLFVYGACFDEFERFVWSINPYDSDTVTEQFTGLALRAVLYCFTLFACFGLACVIPSERSFITALGSRTLYCYLVHVLVIHGSYRLISETWEAPLSFYLVMFGLLLPLIVGHALMMEPVLVLRPIVEPSFRFMWRDDVAPEEKPVEYVAP